MSCVAIHCTYGYLLVYGPDECDPVRAYGVEQWSEEDPGSDDELDLALHLELDEHLNSRSCNFLHGV
jgi:hypothetical protein